MEQIKPKKGFFRKTGLVCPDGKLWSQLIINKTYGMKKETIVGTETRSE